MIRGFLLGILLLSVSCVAMAMQIIPVKDNSRVSVNISDHDFTRFLVIGDRITHVRGLSNRYYLKQDPKLGQVFIMPVKASKPAPFNLFITTENGQSYQLQLRPKKISASSVALRPHLNKSLKATKWEKGGSYYQVLVKLIRAMVNKKPPEGYTYQSVAQAKSMPLGDVAEVTLVGVYQGDHLRGNVYQLKNTSDKPIHLKETQLYRPGARAIALENHIIPADSRTQLFMVISNE